MSARFTEHSMTTAVEPNPLIFDVPCNSAIGTPPAHAPCTVVLRSFDDVKPWLREPPSRTNKYKTFCIIVKSAEGDPIVTGAVSGEFRRSSAPRHTFNETSGEWSEEADTYHVDVMKIAAETEGKGLGFAFMDVLLRTTRSLQPPLGVYLEAARTEPAKWFAVKLQKLGFRPYTLNTCDDRHNHIAGALVEKARPEQTESDNNRTHQMTLRCSISKNKA